MSNLPPVGEVRPYILEILRRLPEIIRLLEPQQVQVFYEAVGYMVAASPSREALIEQLMQLRDPGMSRPNTLFDIGKTEDTDTLFVSLSRSLVVSQWYQRSLADSLAICCKCTDSTATPSRRRSQAEDRE